MNFVKFWFDDDASEQLVRLFKLVLADIGQRLVDVRVPGMTTQGGTFGKKDCSVLFLECLGPEEIVLIIFFAKLLIEM